MIFKVEAFNKDGAKLGEVTMSHSKVTKAWELNCACYALFSEMMITNPNVDKIDVSPLAPNELLGFILYKTDYTALSMGSVAYSERWYCNNIDVDKYVSDKQEVKPDDQR